MIPRGTLHAAIACLGLVLCLVPLEGADKSKTRPQKGTSSKKGSSSELAAPQGLSTAELVQRVKPSLVVLSTRSRGGSGEGVGTGFVIDPAGLVATSLHVVGESQPVTARLASGQTVEVLGLHAFDRHADLAILRVAATNLPALTLGDDTSLATGAEVVAMGNPLGLENSVVAGVLSGRRTFDEIEMLQLAIPIEPGNSGGPLVDRQGVVQGIINAKSLLTQNLGFATPVRLLRPLVERPNPIPYARWIRNRGLDPERWETFLGARWQQRSGRIEVEGAGNGFGGRAYILQRAPLPGKPYEVRVQVRLDDDSGAAGLVFGGDDSGRHYGFYPTGGQLRLTAFEGPEVFDWRILGTVPNPAYRPGDWNLLRVRHEAGHIRCWVNGAEVFSMPEEALNGSRIGLAKFRNTAAEFRDFQSGTNLAPPAPISQELLSSLQKAPRGLDTLSAEDQRTVQDRLPDVRSSLAEQARTLEVEAARLRELATQLHRVQVRNRLVAELDQPEDRIDLARATLLVALHDQPDLDIVASEDQLQAWGEELRGRLKDIDSDAEKVRALCRFLFEENGFHGSRHDYSNPANSHLNQVIDDREGLPITLSIVFLTVGERAGIRHLHGVPLPGHFLVKHAPPGGDEQLFDVFDGGKPLTHSDADELGAQFARVPVRTEGMRPSTKREMIVRMIGNLQSFKERERGAAASLPYADLLVATVGEPQLEASQRLDRARLRARGGDMKGAREDLTWIVDTAPPGYPLEPIRQMLDRIASDAR
ncbi:MAG: putative periplasmic serine endoprotease DegP-like precursor [Verrucomicrobiota bacterium]|jgi:regulator of sirC expression with transglutaminase-like and TPR domain